VRQQLGNPATLATRVSVVRGVAPPPQYETVLISVTKKSADENLGLNIEEVENGTMIYVKGVQDGGLV